MALTLPLPKLAKTHFNPIDAYTDEALFEASGVRIAFTCRSGGVSVGAYDSLNLGSHVNDDLDCVLENRNRVLRALAPEGTELIVPKQVHKDTVLELDSPDALIDVRRQAAAGADGLLVSVPRVAPRLCFADCVPVIIVSPSKRFAVVHAGWRGVMNLISVKAVRLLALQDAVDLGQSLGGNPSPDEASRRDISDASTDVSADDLARRLGMAKQGETPRVEALPLKPLASQFNVYIGPYIHAECFETSEDIHQKFVDSFSSRCDAGYRHIDLGEALRVQLERAGIAPERIADVDTCTVCHNDEFFSYRAQNGVAGRHGAFAVRL